MPETPPTDIEVARYIRGLASDAAWKHPAPEIQRHQAMLARAVENLEDYATLAEEYDGILQRQGDLLTSTVNVLRGDPPPLTTWSHHDIPELARALKDERNQLALRVQALEMRNEVRCTCGYGGFHEPLNENCERNNTHD